MQINNCVKRKMPFKHLKAGDTFVVENKHWTYLKTFNLKMEDDHPVNSIRLNDGAVTNFNDCDEVIFVECELNVLREGW